MKSNIDSSPCPSYSFFVLLSTSVGSILNFILQSFYVKVILYPYLNDESIEMAHLDPSEIIEKPVDSKVILKYISISSITFLFFTTTISTITSTGSHQHQYEYRAMLKCILYTTWKCTQLGLFIFVCCVLSGFDPTTLSSHHTMVTTIMTCLHVAVVSFSSIFTQMFHYRVEDLSLFIQKFYHDILLTSFSDEVEHEKHTHKNNTFKKSKLSPFNISFVWNVSLMYCVIVFALILFPMLRIYDWGSQYQRWPIPLIFGEWIGMGIGMLISCPICVAIFCHYNSHHERKVD